MLGSAAYLVVLLVQFLVGTNAGALVTVNECSDEKTNGCIVYPPASNQTYSIIDAIVVSYNSPWKGGVNLSVNCWPNLQDEGGSVKPIQLSGPVASDSFCSCCPQTGTHEFRRFNSTTGITFPTRCWFALGPYEDADLPADAYNANATTFLPTSRMVTATTGGNFTLQAQKGKGPPRTYLMRPIVWTNLSTVWKASILGGIYAVLVGCIILIILQAVRKSRALENPMNPENQGLFMAERDGTVSYKPGAVRPPDAGMARSFQPREQVEGGESSSQLPLLSGSGQRRLS